MININTLTLEHIKTIQNQDKPKDPQLIEKLVFALYLLEALCLSGMKFIFKGGTALILMVPQRSRFSTDIDIVLSPGYSETGFLDIVIAGGVFIRYEEQIRHSNSAICKRHYKIYYLSPLNNIENYILLDILYEESLYCKTIFIPISNSMLLLDEPHIMVTTPSYNCLIADKLTAFAPHTIGILYHKNKELEILRQNPLIL